MSELRKFWKYGRPYLAVMANKRSALADSHGKMQRDIVGRNREGKDAAAPVASSHDFNEGAVDVLVDGGFDIDDVSCGLRAGANTARGKRRRLERYAGD